MLEKWLPLPGNHVLVRDGSVGEGGGGPVTIRKHTTQPFALGRSLGLSFTGSSQQSKGGRETGWLFPKGGWDLILVPHGPSSKAKCDPSTNLGITPKTDHLRLERAISALVLNTKDPALALERHQELLLSISGCGFQSKRCVAARVSGVRGPHWSGGDFPWPECH